MNKQSPTADGEVCDSPERLGAVELSAVGGGEVTVDVLENQVLHVTEHITQVPANRALVQDLRNNVSTELKINSD